MNEFEEFLNTFKWEDFSTLIRELTQVDRNNLNQEMANLPSQYAYWNAVLAQAKARLDRAAQDEDRYKASKSVECQEMLRSSGKKATAKDMENYVNSSEDYKTKNDTLITLNQLYLSLKGLVQALYAKKDMLVHLSSNERAELKLYN
jgi:uncharacterized protein YyaL (SSP411 family)